MITLEEKEFLEIFKHFNVTSGHGLMEQNLSTRINYLSPPIRRKANEILNELVNKDYINYKSDTNFYILTDLGEKELYGDFNINDGLKELLEMFSHFKVAEGEGIMENNIQAYTATNKMSPLCKKHINEIIQYAIQNNYIMINKNNFYILTEKGEKEAY